MAKLLAKRGDLSETNRRLELFLRGTWEKPLGNLAVSLPAWAGQIEARQLLEKAMKLKGGGNSFEWFILAMADWQLGQQDQAVHWYWRAAQWMEQNRPNDEELRRLRAEARELLKITDQPKPKGNKKPPR